MFDIYLVGHYFLWIFVGSTLPYKINPRKSHKHKSLVTWLKSWKGLEWFVPVAWCVAFSQMDWSDVNQNSVILWIRKSKKIFDLIFTGTFKWVSSHLQWFSYIYWCTDPPFIHFFFFVALFVCFPPPWFCSDWLLVNEGNSLRGRDDSVLVQLNFLIPDWVQLINNS